MKKLPLYPEPLKAAVELEEPLDLDPACDRCDLSKKSRRNTCLRPDVSAGEEGCLLVVGELPDNSDDKNNRPFTGRTGKFFRRLLQKYHRGPVVFDNVVRCTPGRRTKSFEQGKKKYISACRPYLADVVRTVAPSRILVLGTWAMHGVLGRAVPAHSARKGYGFLSNGTPVFLLPDPQDAQENRFFKEEYNEDLHWALTVPLEELEPKWDRIFYSIESAKDSKQAIEYLIEDSFCTFDVETTGHMFNDDFEIISIAICGSGDEEVYVWPKELLRDEEIKVQFRRLFTSDIGWVAHNIKFDAMAVWLWFGVRIEKFHGDTAVWRRLLEANCDARLEVAAELVGMGGHKEEADVVMKREVARIGRKNPGPIDEDKMQYVEKIKSLPNGVKKETYSYGLLPQPVLDRYNALDTLSTSYLHDLLASKLEDKPRLRNVWDNLTLPGLHALHKMEQWGVSADRDSCEAFHTYLEMQLAEIRPHFNQYTDDCFNPDAARDVQDLLFKELGLRPWKFSDKTGKASADGEVLQSLLGQHPIVEHVIEWRRLAKLDGTYARGMIKHIRDDGRMHPNFRIDGTETGRISGSNPNLLNIPRAETKEGKMAKSIFRATPGNRLIQLDFSQQELRVACMLSGDEVMREVFARGEDLHWYTARAISQLAWGIPPDQVEKKHRSFAKSVIFGLVYGKTDHGLAEQLGIAVEEAATIRGAILGRFVKLRTFIKRMLSMGRRDGGVEVPWSEDTVRWRPLPHIGTTADKYKRMKITAENSTINTPVQGLASDFCLASLALIVQWIEREMVPAKVVLSVYDSIIFDVDPYAVDEVVHQARDIMTSWDTKGVPLKVDAEVGELWGDLSEYQLTA